MAHTIQIFIRRSMLKRDNHFPLLNFDTKVSAYDFISKLKSVPRADVNEPHFVINNPQLLPDEVRELHKYPDEDEYMRDGCFTIHDNMEMLMKCEIKNNMIDTYNDFGFNEYLNEYNEYLNNNTLNDDNALFIHMMNTTNLNYVFLKKMQLNIAM